MLPPLVFWQPFLFASCIVNPCSHDFFLFRQQREPIQSDPANDRQARLAVEACTRKRAGAIAKYPGTEFRHLGKGTKHHDGAAESVNPSRRDEAAAPADRPAQGRRAGGIEPDEREAGHVSGGKRHYRGAEASKFVATAAD